MKVLIYSNRHDAWWRKDYAGYAIKIEDAGIYELDDVLNHYPHEHFDFDKGRDDYLVKLEDAVDEFLKRESELLKKIGDEMNSLVEEIEACRLRQEKLGERIAHIAFTLGQIDKGEPE